MVLCECLSLEVVFRCRLRHDPVGPPPEFCCSHRRPVPSETRHQTWLGGPILALEGLFLAANLTKLVHGAWLPLLIGVAMRR
jgi:hypothetical protein